MNMPKNKSDERLSSYSKSGQEFYWIAARSDNQRRFLLSMDENVVTFCKGPAGCGKTILALQQALKALQMRQVDKIYYVRNDIINRTLGSKIGGALPGDRIEKLEHLLGPIVDNLYELCSPGKAKYILNNDQIEPLNFEQLRGRSLMNKFVIADEVQNVPIIGVKTLLSRIGRESKLVLLGDTDQRDLDYTYTDGLKDAFNRLRGVDGLGFVNMNYDDIQRNSLLKVILQRYDQNAYMAA